MKQKIDFKYRSFGIRILISVILIFSVCLILTAYFTGRSYLREQKDSVALKAELLSEKTMRVWTELRIKMSDYVHTNKEMFFHPDSAKILCERISLIDSTIQLACFEYALDFFPDRHLYAPYYSAATHTFGDLAEVDSLSCYDEDPLFNSAHPGSYNLSISVLYPDEEYIRLSSSVYDDDGAFLGIVNLLYSPPSLMQGVESISTSSEQSSLVLVNSDGNYFKGMGFDIQFSFDGDINYLDSIRVFWGEETYSDVLRAMRDINFQTIREVDDGAAYLCITSRLKPFDVMLWKVDMDFKPFHYIFRRNAALFLVSLLLLCLIGYLNMRRLEKLVRSEEKFETEIKDASMIQREMLPSSPLDSPAIDLDAVLLPSAAVGGDCYYYYEKDGLLYFCIGDVVGKGLSAALFMSKIVSLFHNISQYHSEADAIADSMNRELCTGNDDLMFVTMFIAVLDIRTGELRYCNAGHENPAFWSGRESDAPVILDTEHDVPLGIEPDASFTESTMHIAPGAVLCIYTDGVTEAKNDALDMFGSANLLETFSAGCRKDAKTLNSGIVSSVRNFADRHPQSDDITILTIKAKTVDYSVTLENTEKETEKLRALFEYLRDFLYCTDSQLMDIRVAVDEAVTNCINYAYGAGKGLITVRAVSESDGIVFIVRDEGVPFNMLEYKTPDRSDLTVDEMELGGLGIPLIKRTFDSIEYVRDGGSNVLKLRKSIKNI